jgi:hypothetical protein
VRAEFEIAKARGLYIVPVGASGFVADDLWKEVMGTFKDYFPNDTGAAQALMNKLGQPVAQPTDLLQPILDLMNLLAKE